MSMAETPEELEARRRAATARRIKILAALTVAVVAARVLIHDPKRKAPIDYSKQKNIRVVPGMLDTLPAATRAALDPQVVNQMVMADELARRGEYGKPPVSEPTGHYQPADAPAEKDVEAEAYKEQLFAYARRRKIDRERQEEAEKSRDVSKATLVQFASGGYILAETAKQRPDQTYIRLDHTIEANVPSRWVFSIRKDALDWQEPVPAGLVRLHPAKGITVILHRDAASRVTIRKKNIDEI